MPDRPKALAGPPVRAAMSASSCVSKSCMVGPALVVHLHLLYTTAHA
jgi:hypothetical protein